MNPETASDDEFLQAVESATWPGEHFGHRAHLRLAWLYLRRHGLERGTTHIQETIQRYATALGAPGKYDEPLTRAWSAHVWRALEETRGLEPFECFLEAHPELLRKETLP